MTPINTAMTANSSPSFSRETPSHTEANSPKPPERRTGNHFGDQPFTSPVMPKCVATWSGSSTHWAAANATAAPPSTIAATSPLRPSSTVPRLRRVPFSLAPMIPPFVRRPMMLSLPAPIYAESPRFAVLR